MKLPKLASYNKRQFIKCSICSNISFYDYTPYSLSQAIMIPPCNHRMDDQNSVEQEYALRKLFPNVFGDNDEN